MGVENDTTRAKRVTDAPSDADLIRISLREPSVFAEAWTRHAPTLARYVTARVGRDVCDDILSATAVAAFTYRHTFRPDKGRASALPWLLGIATREVSRHHDAERRWLRQIQAGRSIAAERIEAVETIHESRLPVAVVAEAMEQIPVLYRDPLLLRLVAELDYRSIADALNIPEGTVRSRIHRGRELLAMLLRRHLDD